MAWRMERSQRLNIKESESMATIVEDTMWERWIRDDDGRLIDGRESDDDGFKKFMLDNKDEVYELIELAMESEEQTEIDSGLGYVRI